MYAMCWQFHLKNEFVKFELDVHEHPNYLFRSYKACAKPGAHDVPENSQLYEEKKITEISSLYLRRTAFLQTVYLWCMPSALRIRQLHFHTAHF